MSTGQLSGSIGFNLDMSPRWIWVSDGEGLALFDTQTGGFDPAAANQRWFVHPLEMAGPVMEMLFPTYLAPRSEDLQVVRAERFVDRSALVIDWAAYRLTVDAQTEVLLRQQKLDEIGQVTSETALQAIAYDLPIPPAELETTGLEDSHFEPPPAGVAVSTPPSSPTPLPRESITSQNEIGKLLVLEDTSGEVVNGVPAHALYRFGPGESLVKLYEPPKGKSITGFSVSPFGNQVVFSLDDPGSGQAGLYILSLFGKAPVQFGDPAMDEYDPQWSPDGNWIVYVSQQGSHTRIMRRDSSGEDPVNLTPDGDGFSPRWSPDGQWIVFDTNRDGKWEVYRMSPDGSQLTNLTQNPADDRDGILASYGWHLAFTSDRDGARNVYVLDLQTGETNRVSPLGSRILPASLSWSPDGRYLAFVSSRGAAMMNALNLLLWDSQTGETIDLTQNIPHQTVSLLAWSPDSRQAAVQWETGGPFRASIVDIETQTAYPLNLPDGFGVWEFYWGSLASAD